MTTGIWGSLSQEKTDSPFFCIYYLPVVFHRGVGHYDISIPVGMSTEVGIVQVLFRRPYCETSWSYIEDTMCIYRRHTGPLALTVFPPQFLCSSLRLRRRTCAEDVSVCRMHGQRFSTFWLVGFWNGLFLLQREATLMGCDSYVYTWVQRWVSRMKLDMNLV